MELHLRIEVMTAQEAEIFINENTPFQVDDINEEFDTVIFDVRDQEDADSLEMALQDIFWDDDFPFICSMVIKTIKDSTSNKIELFELFKDTDEKDFALNLLRQSIIHAEDFSELISSKTKNWDLERVAQMDLILMQMTLAELLKMPSVPVKVTINEYIELAKYYSTPNSKNFVNGILDSLLIELKREGAIKKMGRGLIE